MKEKVKNRAKKACVFNSIYSKPELVYECNMTYEVERYGSYNYTFYGLPFVNKSNKVNQIEPPEALFEINAIGDDARAELVFDQYAIPLDKKIVIEELAINGVSFYTPDSAKIADMGHRDDLPDFIRVDIIGPYREFNSRAELDDFIKRMFGEMNQGEKKNVHILCRISAFF